MMFSDFFEEFNDGDPVNDKIRDVMEYIEEGRVSFCGFVWKDEKGYIFWPKGYNSGKSDKEKFQSLKLLFNSFAMHNKQEQMKASMHSSYFGHGKNIVSYLEILQDFIANGIYENTERNYGYFSNGKIDWSQTIRKTDPVFNKKNIPVYSNVISSKTVTNENLVSEIHRHAVGQIDKVLGWFFADKNLYVAREYHNKRNPVSSDMALNLIKSELDSSFSETRIRLLRNLLNFFQEKNIDDLADKDKEHYFGLKNYHTLWEDMCRVYLGGKTDLFDFPYPVYRFDDEDKTEKKQQRPDILFREGNEVGIVDAKYYDINYSKPGWPDLIKQFYYAKSLEAIKPGISVKNWFVFPETIGDLPQSIVVKDSKEKILNNYPPIQIMYLKIKEVTQHYVSRKVNRKLRNSMLNI